MKVKFTKLSIYRTTLSVFLYSVIYIRVHLRNSKNVFLLLFNTYLLSLSNVYIFNVRVNRFFYDKSVVLVTRRFFIYIFSLGATETVTSRNSKVNSEDRQKCIIKHVCHNILLQKKNFSLVRFKS